MLLSIIIVLFSTQGALVVLPFRISREYYTTGSLAAMGIDSAFGAGFTHFVIPHKSFRA
jgi:hypothetical protein